MAQQSQASLHSMHFLHAANLNLVEKILELNPTLLSPSCPLALLLGQVCGDARDFLQRLCCALLLRPLLMPLAALQVMDSQPMHLLAKSYATQLYALEMSPIN